MSQLTLPEAFTTAASTTAKFDQLLGSGLARISDPAPVLELAAAVGNTPLGKAAAEAAASIAGGDLAPHHLSLLAAARASIEAARFDAAFAVACDALGLSVDLCADGDDRAPSAEQAAAMEGVRHWLVEIAFAGLAQLEVAAISPAVDSLRTVQQDPQLARLATSVTGFVHELLEHAPTAKMNPIPARRWADLWTNAFLATYALPDAPAEQHVSGELTPLGVDMRHHDHVVSVVVHGLLETDGQRRFVRTTLSAWKVDAIGGDEIWKLIETQAPALIAALVKPATLQVSDLPLLAGRDLRWDTASISAGTPCQPWDLDFSDVLISPPPPRDRHLLALDIPCHSHQLDIAMDDRRSSRHTRLDESVIETAKGVIGLLRFDDEWSVQPLAAVAARKKVLGPAEGIAIAAKIKKPSLDVLTERASKLLRG